MEFSADVLKMPLAERANKNKGSSHIAYNEAARAHTIVCETFTRLYICTRTNGVVCSLKLICCPKTQLQTTAYTWTPERLNKLSLSGRATKWF